MSLNKPKRARGRPKKILTSTELREKEAKPKRARGRPKKILTSNEKKEKEAKLKKILTSNEKKEKDFHKTKRGTSTLSPFTILQNIKRFNNYNKIIDYFTKINLSKYQCLELHKINGSYELTPNLILYKKLGSKSVYGMVYKCKNINPNFNIPRFTAKIQLKSKQSMIEISILNLITNYSIKYNIPHLPIIYKAIECSKIIRDDKYPALLAKARSKHKKYQIILNELASGDLSRFFDKYLSFFKYEKFFKNLYEQLFISLVLIHSMGLSHNDCHTGNFLYHKIKPGGCFHYKINGIDYYIENIGFLWTTWDFGISSRLYKYGDYINDYMYFNAVLRPNKPEMITEEFINHDFYGERNFKLWGYLPSYISVPQSIKTLQTVLWKHLGELQKYNDISIIQDRKLTEDLWLKFLLDNNYLFSKTPIGEVLSDVSVRIPQYKGNHRYEDDITFVIDKIKL